MEHMVLSYTKDTNFRKQEDFEDWLADKGGASNAFTAFQQTCFYFNGPHDIFGRALLRFSSLFVEANILDICHNNRILEREVRRVNSELDLETIFSQTEYVTKSFVNFENPYSRFARGNIASLETIPGLKGLNVADQLIKFFHQYYLPTQAVLVVVSNQQDFSSIQRWITVTQFSVALSQRKNNMAGNFVPNFYPGRFLRGNRLKHLVLLQKNDSSSSTDKEKLIIQWVLNEDYRGLKTNNAVEIAFVLNQILGRRGPGSLYQSLRKQGWILNGSAIPPQISVPVNVSGFQILKLELSLTLEGFLNRSKVVSALYASIDILRNPGTDTYVVTREIMAQYATTAKLFGYTLAPRPPDAIELAMDSIAYGITRVETGKWYRFPSTEDLGGLGLNRMRRAVSSALSNMNDPENALIIVTAGPKAIDVTQHAGGKKNPIPSPSSPKWNTERISGARLYFEDMLPSRSRVRQTYLTNMVIKEEFLPPVYNPFVLTSLRPPRTTSVEQLSPIIDIHDETSSACERMTWAVLMPGKSKMPLPRMPPEANCRCAFVLQLLSPRPTTASAEEAANAELWKHSFYVAALDLAELGVPGALAYELRFNIYGLRISFLGLSQTIASYARRVAQLLVKHQQKLLKGPKTLSKSVTTNALVDANRARGLSPSRKRIIFNTMQKASAYDVAHEGTSFLQSCTGVVSFSEGDLIPTETESLLNDLRIILKDSIGIRSSTDIEQEKLLVIPSIEDLVDTPIWKPRNASPCYVPGVSLMSDACGRIQR